MMTPVPFLTMWTIKDHSVSAEDDVFLSHSAKDKAVVRPLAERLRQDRLKVLAKFGFRNSDFGIGKPGMSGNAFGSNWAELEADTFRLNRSNPLRIQCSWTIPRKHSPMHLHESTYGPIEPTKR
jgi:hypothetical protein